VVVVGPRNAEAARAFFLMFHYDYNYIDIYMLLGLPDRLKFFQGSFVILWLLKFYFMPILNAFWIYWRSKFFQTNIYE